MPSHYGKERSKAAARRAPAQRLTARGSRALAAKKRKDEKPKRERVFGKVTPRRPGEAPELKAHGVKPSK